MLLLLSPNYFLKDCLGLHIDAMVKKELAAATGKTERTIANWQKSKKFPDKSWRNLNLYFERKGGKRLTSLVDKIDENSQFMSVIGQQWKFFSLPLLNIEDFFLSRTFTKILIMADSDVNFFDSALILSSEEKLNFYKKYLINTVGKTYEMPSVWIDEIEKADSFESVKRSIVDVIFESILYFLAMADAEYCIDSGKNEPFLNKYIPTYIDEKSINCPVEIFFRNFFNSLIEQRLFKNNSEIAAYIDQWLDLEGKESVERQMRRILNKAHVPSWKTLQEWLLAILRSGKISDMVDEELEDLEIKNAEIIYGGVRILDRTLKEFLNNCHGQNSIEYFSRYKKWFDIHYQELVSCGGMTNHAPAGTSLHSIRSSQSSGRSSSPRDSQ